jgi:hypothetical protein
MINISRGTGKISTRKLKHERADEGAGVRVSVRVSEGEGEGEVKRVLSSSKVTSARSCLSFLVLIFH